MIQAKPLRPRFTAILAFRRKRLAAGKYWAFGDERGKQWHTCVGRSLSGEWRFMISNLPASVLRPRSIRPATCTQRRRQGSRDVIACRTPRLERITIPHVTSGRGWVAAKSRERGGENEVTKIRSETEWMGHTGVQRFVRVWKSSCFERSLNTEKTTTMTTAITLVLAFAKKYSR